MFGADELDERGREILGLRSLRPFDGERAEKRWCEDDDDSVGAWDVEAEATDDVDDLRKPLNDMDSRFDFLGRMLEDADPLTDWRGTRDDDEVVGGDAFLAVPVIVDLLDALSPSMTPNSFMPLPIGEGFADVLKLDDTLTLVRRAVPLSVGEPPMPDVLLEMHGILVGVSFDRPEIELLNEEIGGPSLPSRTVCELAVPTDGEPAIVGSWVRLLSELSDCFCIELTV